MNENVSRKNIDITWSKYKYVVMERSYKKYKNISKNIGLNMYTYDMFTAEIDSICKLEPVKSQSINTLQHIWGYFKKNASKEDKNVFLMYLEKYVNDEIELYKVKTVLKEYAIKYESSYLLNSYYFDY